jgi:anti-sigma factor RsiW
MDLQPSDEFSRKGGARTAYGCADAQKRLWEYLDDELPLREAALVRRHVQDCPQCGPLAAFDRALLDRIAAVEPAHHDLTALRGRIRWRVCGRH